MGGGEGGGGRISISDSALNEVKLVTWAGLQVSETVMVAAAGGARTQRL